jgi:hypothetical protein
MPNGNNNTNNTTNNGTNWGDPVTTLMGMGYDQLTMGQQNEQTEHFMGIQHQNNMEMMQQQFMNQTGLNIQGHQLQFEMWLKTNYPAQVEQMKKAGLNVGLMYGMKGGGGTTTGSQGGGSAAGGQAGLGMAPQRRKEMQVAELMMGLQMDKLKADTKLVEAQAENESGGEKDKLQEEVNALIAKTKITDEQRRYIGKEFQLALDQLKNEIEKTGVMKIGAEAQKSGAAAQHKIADAKQIDTLTKKIELTIREKIAKMNIDQSNKEAWMRFASDQIGNVLRGGTEIFKALTKLEGDLAKAFGEIIPG